MNYLIKKIAEYFAFTYFNWLVVVPSLIPFMILWVKVDNTQLIDWIIMSVFTSMYIGWVTVKADSIFAPWFYRKMKMNRKTREFIVIERIEKELKKWKRLSKEVYPNLHPPKIIEILEDILSKDQDKFIKGNK